MYQRLESKTESPMKFGVATTTSVAMVWRVSTSESRGARRV